MMKFNSVPLHVYPFYPLSFQLLQSLFLCSWNVCANDFFGQETSLVWRSQLLLVWQTFYNNRLLNSYQSIWSHIVWHDFYCWKTENSPNIYTTFRWCSLSYHRLNLCLDLPSSSFSVFNFLNVAEKGWNEIDVNKTSPRRGHLLEIQDA